MRRYAICLLFLLLVFTCSRSWSARRQDSAGSDKGQADNTCTNDPGTTDPYTDKRFSLTQLTGTTTSGTTYVATVDVYAWGDYICGTDSSGSATSTEDPATEDTVLGVNVLANTGATPPAGSYNLVSFRLNNYLPISPKGPAFISCQFDPQSGAVTGITPCDNQSEGDFYPVPEPSPVSGADGNGTVWTFGEIFQLDSANPTFNASPFQLTTTPTGLAAAVLVPGCAPNPSATPPQSCIGSDMASHANGLSPQTSYTVVLQDTSSGQVLVLGNSPSLQALPGLGHDVFSTTNYNPVSITQGVFANIYDLSANYPQLDATTGAPNYNGLPPTAFPPPCASNTNPCISTGFSNASFHSMWFDFVPQNNAPVSVSTANSHFDTILSVFTGTAGSLQGVSNGIDDDNPNATIAQNPQSSAVVFQGTKGVTYHILVSEYPPTNSVNPASNPGVDTYEAPLSSDPTLYFALTTPQLSANPSTLPSFGSVPQNTSSAPMAITLMASYSSGTNGISGIAPSISAGSSDFQIASDSTCMSSLADQGTCTLNIVFSPSASGMRMGTLTVSSSAENGPLTISLSGTGVQGVPILNLSTTPLSFANQLVNTASNTTSVVLGNTGTAALTVSASATGDFTQTNNCSSVAAGGQCSIAVTFTPTQAGSRNGQLSITDNTASSPQTIALSGTGTDFALQAAPGSQLSATISSGGTATYNVVVAPISGFVGTVALTCTGPAPVSGCTPSSPNVSVNGSPASFTVSVTTSASAQLASPDAGLRSLAIMLIPVGVSTFFFGIGRRRTLFVSMVCIGFILLTGSLVSCGGGGTPPTSTTPTTPTTPTSTTTSVTLSGVSGGQTRTATLTLITQ